jgi:threonylcarbamoyladenosine tRNA methylthiotransferase MtaB
MAQPRTCRLLTLGCKVNQYETQYVKELLEKSGYREAKGHESADLCVVNTCTVTHEADAKGRQLIRRLARDNPTAAIVVMGCYATRAPAAVGQLPRVARVITDKNRIVDELAEFGVKETLPGISRFDGHRRAFVKVQDGCLLNCSFCVIPSVRPVLRSRPIEEIEDEVRRMVATGCQEVVLTGIHLGHYGIDLSKGKPKSSWSRLWHLIERLDRMPGHFRVRLSSLEAAEVRGELVETLAQSTKICPHLHLCLQSGSDRILARMRRRYRVAGFLERCRRLRSILDNPAFTTDVIVGFPGETDFDFEETCRAVREVGFSRIHIFSFSARSGTVAANLPDRVPADQVAERRARLLEIESELARAYYQGLIGHRLDVLVEGEDVNWPGSVRGTSCRYAPVSFKGCLPALLARRVPVLACGVGDGFVLATPEPDNELYRSATSAENGFRRVPLPQVDLAV